MPTRDEVLALTEQVGNLAEEVHGEREAKKWAVRILGTALAVVLVIAVRGQQTADKAQKAADKAQEAVELVIAQRDDARVAACEKDNADANRENTKLDRDKDLLDDTFNNPAGRERTPEQQSAVDAYLADQYAQYDALRSPLRDCSRKGIEAFYAAQGATS